MKKIFYFMMAAIASVLFMASCEKCSQPEPQPADEAVLITSNVFEENVSKIDSIVRERYPEALFFEASTRFVDEDGNIDPQDMMVAYGSRYRIWSLLATVQNDTLVFTEYDEPWCEDEVTTPYVPMDAAFAVKLLKNSIDENISVTGMPVVLRHQLYLKEPEPRFFIGTISSCHTVNVYTGIIDQPLNQATDSVAIARDARIEW